MERTQQKQDRRVRKTEQAIYEAFESLLSEKKYSEITVKELTERADITRKTFYLHYGSLDDVLYEFLSGRIDKIWTEIWGLNEGSREDFLFRLDTENYVKLFSGLRESLGRGNIKLSRLMEDDITRQTVYQILMERQKEMRDVYQERYGIDPEVAKLYAAFVSYGFNAMFMRWYTSPDPLPVEEFAQMMMDIASRLRNLPETWGKNA